MLQPEKLFGNIFDDRQITGLRLSNFSEDTITKFTVANTVGQYTATIDALTAVRTPFIAGLSSIDTSKNTKKGKTQIVQVVKKAFSDFLGVKEGVIADAVGGFGTPAYLAFFPKGLSEYSRATKAQMPILVKRINTAATEHAAQLGEKLTTQLQAFEMQWEAVLREQAQLDGSLSDGRNKRDTLRIGLETALLSAIHLVASQYPGDVAKCMSFFNFTLLTNNAHTAQPTAPPAKAD